ncbi:MAG: J domain-containing protein [Pseudomonadota bacterium]
MTEQITAYPLAWPVGWPRTDDSDRRWGNFGTRDSSGQWPRNKDITINQARIRVQEELERFDGKQRNWSRIDPDEIVISTNLKLRLDGNPRSDQSRPDDPGVALYFELDGKRQCIPCDAYLKVEQNIAAIAATLAALRTLERHGSGIMERAFTGFTALPPPVAGEAPWYSVLGVDPDASPDVIKRAYNKRRSLAHPDKGGHADTFDQVEKAWAQYQEQVG